MAEEAERAIVISIEGLPMLAGTISNLAETLAENEQMLGEVGQYGQDSIKIRTWKKGLGADGNRLPFWKGSEPYHPSYKRLREQHKRPVDRVYLKWTGGLAGAMRQKQTREQVSVFFSSARAKPIRLSKTYKRKVRGRTQTYKRKNPTRRSDITEAQKAQFVHELRPFFSLDEDQIKKIVSIFEQRIQQALERGEGGNE